MKRSNAYAKGGTPDAYAVGKRCQLLGLGLMSALLVGRLERQAAAQVPPAAAPLVPGRLTVRPQTMATGTRTARAGEQHLDSLKDYLVYVPQQCVGTRRCPLVVYLPGGGEISRKVMNRERPRADKYGMILFVPNAVTPGRWDIIVGAYIMWTGDREGNDLVGRFPPAARALEVDSVLHVVRKMPYAPDVRNIDAALKQILRTFAIDPNEIALAGASDGGSYSLFLGRNNWDVFSRIAARSPQIHFRGAPTRPRNPRTQILVTGGTDEMETPLEAAQELEHDGHYVKRLGGFRPHDQRPEDHEYIWRWLQESWAIPDPAARPAPAIVADSLPVLTSDIVARMAAFWTAFARAPDSIRTTARLTHLQEVAVPVGQIPLSVFMVDLPALAAQYPSVTAALKSAGLTAHQHQAYRIALYSAYIASQVGALVGPLKPMSVQAQNLTFVQAHQEELQVFGPKATGMWHTP